MITPAISVLSAVEGLNVATPVFEPYVVPVTVAILIGLFAIQRHGTDRVGRLFGPVMLVWFVVIAVLGVGWLVHAPRRARRRQPASRRDVLPGARLARLRRARRGGPGRHRRRGALRRHGPLRQAADPAGLVRAGAAGLLLNYFGQGALLLANPAAASNPFFLMAPGWAAAAAGGAGHAGRDHRVAGADLRRVLAHPAGRAARLLRRAWTSSTPRRPRSARSTCRRSTGC